VSQQFQDEDFPSLSGARVVRIATHPDFHKMGYGTRALQILKNYYEGRIVNLNEDTTDDKMDVEQDEEEDTPGSLRDEKIRLRKNIPPLLLKLSERPPEKLHYWGVSYGVTPQLFKFWRKAGFAPVYLRLTPNELTGEHTCIMLQNLDSTMDLSVAANPDWLHLFSDDFRRRFVSLLSYEFRSLPCELAFLMVATRVKSIAGDESSKVDLKRSELDTVITIHDVKRLEAYSKSLLDYHVIIDLIPVLAKLYFLNKLGSAFSISPAQALFLLGLGLQHRTIDEVAVELELKSNQIMALFNKVIRKFVKHFTDLEEKEEAQQLPEIHAAKDVKMNPLTQTLDEDLDEAGAEARKKLERDQNQLLKTLDLKQFAVIGDEKAWDASSSNKKTSIPNIVSVRKMKRAVEEEEGKDKKTSSKDKKSNKRAKHNDD
jgi:N-acetyltransferase 10